MADIRILVEGADKLSQALKQFPRETKRYIQAAGKEAASEVLNTQGLQRYPPATEANQPGRISIATQEPMGYYQRGKGWWYPVMRKSEGYTGIARNTTRTIRRATGVAGYRLQPTSERYGTQFYTKADGYATEIGNRASYARWLAGDDQAQLSAARGWRRLLDVVQKKLPRIMEIYDGWVAKLIKDLKLD